LSLPNRKQSDELEQVPVVKKTDSDGLSLNAWKIIAVVVLGPLMTQMDSTVVNVSLSTIRHEFQSSIASTQWIISGYLLALALMLPLNGWLVDRLGAKKLYLGCFSAFTFASLFCGAARTINELIGARIIQGMAGGLLVPLTQMMMAKVAGKHMARAIGYAAVPVLLAPILGPVLAGVILKYASWSWLFYINLPVGVLAVSMAAFILPTDEVIAKKIPFDFLGFLLISPGLACFLYGFEQASHDKGFTFLIAGLILLFAFAWHANKHKTNALINIDLFKNRIFTTATITQFFANGIMYAGQFLIPLYLTTGCGLTAERAGWLLAPMGIGMLCVYPFMGFLTDKFGCRAITCGGVFFNFLGTLPFLWMANNYFLPTIALFCLFLRGIGQGATGIPVLSAAYASVPKNQLGFAATAMNIVQRLGGPIATTVIAIVMSLSAKYLPVTGSRAFLIPFVALLGFQLLVLSSALFLPLHMSPNSKDIS